MKKSYSRVVCSLGTALVLSGGLALGSPVSASTLGSGYGYSDIRTDASAAAAVALSASTSATRIASYKAWALNSANWNSRTPAGKRGIDADGAHRAQCADLGIAWARRVGRPVGFDGNDGSGAAKRGWHVVGRSFAAARAGDVVTRVGGRQHVVVVTGNPASGRVQVIQQNPGSPAVSTYATGTSGVVWRLN